MTVERVPRPLRVVDFEEVAGGNEVRLAWSNGGSERVPRETFLALISAGRSPAPPPRRVGPGHSL